MVKTKSPNPSSTRTSTDVEVIQAIMRLWRIVRFRKRYVLSAVFLVGLLGALYYVAATRIYLGTASVLVTQIGPDLMDSAASPHAHRDSFIPTF